MASMIWLGCFFPGQQPANIGDLWDVSISSNFNRTIYTSDKAFIAKGNVIEGIEAKW